uniref:UBA domain-containing protein n=1 Tax=Lotharella oceanica TaxID=641309 RepID=A0A7S2TWE9_9EUKA
MTDTNAGCFAHFSRQLFSCINKKPEEPANPRKSGAPKERKIPRKNVPAKPTESEQTIPSAAPSSILQDQPTDEARLIEMGFEAGIVKAALAFTSGDFNELMDFLVSAAPSQPLGDPYEGEIMRLVEMGYDVEASTAALVASGGDLHLTMESLHQAQSKNLERFHSRPKVEDTNQTKKKKKQVMDVSSDSFLELRTKVLTELVKTVRMKKGKSAERKGQGVSSKTPPMRAEVTSEASSEKAGLAKSFSVNLRSLVYRIATKEMVSFLFSMAENLPVKVQNALTLCKTDVVLPAAAAQLTRKFADFVNEELEGCHLEDINLSSLLKRDECLTLAIKVAEEMKHQGSLPGIQAWQRSRHMFFPLIILLFWMGRTLGEVEDYKMPESTSMLDEVLQGTYVAEVHRARATEPPMVTIAKGMSVVIAGRDADCELTKLVSRWMQQRAKCAGPLVADLIARS